MQGNNRAVVTDEYKPGHHLLLGSARRNPSIRSPTPLLRIFGVEAGNEVIYYVTLHTSNTRLNDTCLEGCGARELPISRG